MDTKLLMIGDWVIVNSKPTKVEAVDGGSINTTYSYGEVEDYIDEDEIYPIPLTPEILEKNGWDMYGCPDHKCWEHYHGSQYVPFSICLFDFMNKGSMYGDDFYEQIIIHVRFVHELQRVLRCCGLWDLADSFVV